MEKLQQWSALMVGKHTGLISHSGDQFLASPEHYERFEIVRADHAYAEITSLRAENEALLNQLAEHCACKTNDTLRNSARYVWLRDNHETDPVAVYIHGNVPPDEWDEAIDAALAAKE